MRYTVLGKTRPQPPNTSAEFSDSKVSWRRRALTGRTRGLRSPAIRIGAIILVLAALVILGFILPVGQIFRLDNVLALILFAVATNILIGYSGLMSFGQAAFYGLGAYVVAGGVIKLGQPFWLTMIEAPVAGGIIATAVGALALRTRGLYFALTMVAFSQLFYAAAIKLYPVTNGENGIFGSVLPSTLSIPRHGYYLALAIVGTSLLVLWLITRSPFGLVLRALRDNVSRAESIGIPRYSHQLIAFAVSGAFCAIAGTIFAIGNQSANPGMLNWIESSIPVVAIILGGMGYFLGPALGAVIYQYGHDLAVQYTSHWQLVLGLVIILVVLLAPGGVGRLVTLLNRLRPGTRSADTSARGRLVRRRRGRDGTHT
jgi:branched-chain amino acid transport system permease protein